MPNYEFKQPPVYKKFTAYALIESPVKLYHITTCLLFHSAQIIVYVSHEDFQIVVKTLSEIIIRVCVVLLLILSFILVPGVYSNMSLQTA